MNSVKYSDNYKSFITKRERLLSLIKQQMVLLKALDIRTWVENLQKVQNRVSTDSFKVLVIGEFKRGKSTFINALLGQEILPAYSEPCTAIISEIKWGELSRVVLYYYYNDDLITKTKEISVEQLEEYVTIPLFDDENAIKLHDKYEKVEIFWPLELCRNGVEFIDSPGLNENRVRSNMTQSYLPIVDATLFVLSCEALASESELKTIEIMRTSGHKDIFFVANKFDIIREKEREKFKKFARHKLAPLTQIGEDGVFFISAINALDGRLDNDEQKIINSGILTLEKELEKFLSNDRGRIKILEPTKVLQESIKAAQNTLPARKAMLNTNRDELERRYRDAQEPLRLLKVKQEQIERRISQFCEDLGHLVETRAYDFYGYLADKVEDWVKSYELKNQVQITVNIFNFEETINNKVKDIVKELSEYLVGQIEFEFVNWQKEQLEPFLSSRLESLKIDLDARASDFIKKVEELRFQLAGNDNPPEAIKNALERLLLASGIARYTGTNVKDIRLEDVISFGSTITNVATLLGTIFSITSGLGIILVGVLVPIILPVATLAVAGLGIYNQQASPQISRKIENEIKQKTSSSFEQEIIKIKQSSSEQIAKDIVVNLTTIQKAIDDGLTQEVDNLTEQVDTVLSEKEKGEANVVSKLDELEEVSETLKKLDGEVDDLIVQLIQI